MSAATWTHFTNSGVLAVESVEQNISPGMKPRGLWISDESDETSWSAWCASEDYGIGRYAYRVELAADAALLVLSSPDEIRAFHDQWSVKGVGGWSVAWAAIAVGYQGILITPYQWSMRLSDVRWYYGWDCASGCIWDADAIASVTAVEAVSR